MAESIDSKFNYSFYDESWKPLTGDDASLHQKRFGGYEDRYLAKKKDAIEELTIEKDANFLETEENVRNFFSSYGFNDLPDIYLVAEDEEDRLDIQAHKPTIAAIHHHQRVVVVRDKRIQELKDTAPHIIHTALAHELAHGTVAEKNKHIATEYIAAEDTYKYHSRTGFGVAREGSFYEEGFATYTASLYDRSQQGDTRPIGIAGRPSIELPDYIAPPDPSMTSGPDGYTMELFGYYAQESHAMSAEGYRDMLFDTRRIHTRAFALRAFARLVDQIKPGLYVTLRKLDYDKTAWQNGLEMTHSAIMESPDIQV